MPSVQTLVENYPAPPEKCLEHGQWNQRLRISPDKPLREAPSAVSKIRTKVNRLWPNPSDRIAFA